MKVRLIYRVFSFVLILVLSVIANAQVPDTLWTKTFGGPDSDYGNSVRETSDGGFILLGVTNSYGEGGTDVWLIKTDAEGNELWNKTFGGTGFDSGNSVEEIYGDGFVLLGGTDSYGAGDYDFWLIKTDAEGNELWNKTFGGTGYDYGYSLAKTSDGGFILLGDTFSYGSGGRDFWLIKTDSDGNEIWNKTFGGNSDDAGCSVMEVSDGGFILLGYTKSFGIEYEDFWLIRTDSDGNEIWNKTFGGPSYDYGYAVKETMDGGFILLGDTFSYGSGDEDIWLIKTDSDGNELWNQTFGGSGLECGFSIEENSEGAFILLGYTDSFGAGNMDYYLVKTEDGDKIWEETIGGKGSDIGNSIILTSDDGFVLLGYSSSFGSEDENFWLVKMKYPPSLFSLLSPADEDTIISKSLIFDWDDSTDPYSGNIVYDLYIDTDSEFSNPVIISEIEESSYSYTEVLPNGTTYYWKVNAKNEIGLTTWSNETRSFFTNYEEDKCELLSTMASDGIIGLEGIDGDDYVQFFFDKPTDKPDIDASNIDDIFRLSGGHTWLDGEGGVKDALWNVAGDKFIIYFSMNSSPPTVAPGDTITPNYYCMTKIPCIISGSFDPSSVKRSDIPSGIPSELTLYPNRPNPFNPITTISVGVPEESRVIVSIFDLHGRLVKRLFDGVKPVGTAVFIWNANGLTSGVYLCRVEMPHSGSIRTEKMMLLK